MPNVSRYYDADLDMWIPAALAPFWIPALPTITRVACGYRIEGAR